MSCFWCDEDETQVQPCQPCLVEWEKGIMLLEVIDNCFTGRYFRVTQEWVSEVVPHLAFEKIILINKALADEFELIFKELSLHTVH